MTATLYPFQQDAVEQLLGGKHIIIAQPGAGKTAVSLAWAERVMRSSGKHNLLVITTAQKSHTTDFQDEAKIFAPSMKPEKFEVVSWHMAKKWCDNKTPAEVTNYVVIFDECLPADTKVTTILGEKDISNIELGDKVLSYNHDKHSTEYKTVTRIIKKPSPQKMIRLLLSNGTVIISTGNHPHYTDNGYKEAKDIKVGDTLYEEGPVRKTKICTIKSPKIWGVHRMRYLSSKNTRSDIEAESTNKTSEREEELLLNGLCQSGYERKWKTSDGYTRDERAIESKSRGENDQKQSVPKQKNDGKNVSYKKEKRLATNMGKKSRAKRWKWALHRSSDKVMGRAEQDRQRLGNGTASVFDKERTWIPNLLQIRCRQCVLQDRGGVRWGWSQQAKSQSKRQEEGRQISPVRVESVEVLELADIKRLGLYREPDYVYCLDVEDNHNFFANGVLTHNCQKSKQGVSSLMGKAFLFITKNTDTWAGFTGTPGDTWIDFHAYFVACGKVRHKTEFLRKFCYMQTYPFPKIVGYAHEDVLRAWWAEISYTPDASVVMSQLPSETHQVMRMPAPRGYKKVLKTSTTLDGEFLDSNMALLHELRQMCATPDKLSALSDLLESLSSFSPLVVFYNYTCEREQILGLAEKLGRKVWRIDGECHEIPTAETIGVDDIVLCHYLSGSEALNVQFCHYWLSYSYNYSYSTSIQARGRIKRIGQKNKMHYFYFKCEGTIEEDVEKALKHKSDFSKENWSPERS